MERSPPPSAVDGEEDYKVEAFLRCKGKSAQRLYRMLWRDCLITKASWEPKSHLKSAPQILEACLNHTSTME